MCATFLFTVCVCLVVCDICKFGALYLDGNQSMAKLWALKIYPVYVCYIHVFIVCAWFCFHMSVRFLWYTI